MFRKGLGKYGARRTNGFPSALENAVYEMLLLRERAKEISDIKRQVRVELTRAAIATKIDFSFIEARTGDLVFAEAKGVKTERYRLIERLWRFYGPSRLEVWGGHYKKLKILEIIEPEGE